MLSRVAGLSWIEIADCEKIIKSEAQGRESQDSCGLKLLSVLEGMSEYYVESRRTLVDITIQQKNTSAQMYFIYGMTSSA